VFIEIRGLWKKSLLINLQDLSARTQKVDHGPSQNSRNEYHTGG
jgi:hypothetical protein